MLYYVYTDEHSEHTPAHPETLKTTNVIHIQVELKTIEIELSHYLIYVLFVNTHVTNWIRKYI